MFHFSNIARSKGDPKIVERGSSLARPEDRMARALGWFSIGLGAMQLFSPRRVTRTLGMEGSEMLVRAFGTREILSGIMSLSVDKNAGLWARVGGDGMDAAVLLAELTSDNPRKGNVLLALAMVGGIAMLDYRTAQETTPRRPQPNARRRLYPDRSGFPKGLSAAKGSAKALANQTGTGSQQPLVSPKLS
jgi:hypothetical protein